MDQRTRTQLDIASRSSMFAYANTAVVIPISLVAITTELGLTYTQAGALSLIGSLMQFAILLASIPISAFIGKIRPLRWGMWILALGLLIFTRVMGFVSAFLVITIIAFGQAVVEALITPLVEDIHPGDDGSNQVLLHSFWPMGVIFGTLVIGEALTRGVSWRTIFLILGLACIIVGALYPRRSRAHLPRSRADFSHAGEILSQPIFWVMGFALFFAGGAEGGLTYWSATYIQVEYGTLARAGGMGTAFFALGMAAGRIFSSRIAGKFGLKRILMVSTVVALAGGLGFTLVRSLPTLYILMVIMGFCIAPFWPGIQTLTVRKMGVDPTMVMAFLSCFGLLGFSIMNFTMGIIGDLSGLRTSFLVVPAALAVLLLLLSIGGRLTPEKPRPY
ncbi:MAG: MFS transporter [Spirochaetaceae bacterium]|nr:MFS transporter [Spirochaetaceae bacterium]